nr:condensation domain-containing protein [uncultured bacterium]
MSDLEKRLAGLSPEKLALLMQQLRKKGEAGARPLTIPRRGERDVHPLSFAQQRLWFIDQLEPGNYAHNILTAVRFSGEFDRTALERAIGEIVRRHESLRATFRAEDGRPMQIISDALPGLLRDVDLEQFPEPEREAEVMRTANAEVLRPFDLERGPMLRATLMRLGAREHVLLFTMHHIISDGWSRGVLIQEFSALYDAFVSGRPSPLPELPIQYADYAAWQHERLQGELLERELGYWTKQFEGFNSVLELPTDRVRPAVQSFRGARHHFAVPPHLVGGLEELARAEGATLFITLLAAFKVLLMRYTRQQDIVVGSPVANRSRVETEGLIGFFANTLALRTDLSGDPTFRELLARTRRVALGAYAHQELPFERLVEELRPERDLSRTPLFQVMFLLDNTPLETLKLSGLEVNPIEFDGKISPFDLSLHLEQRSGGVRGSFEYNTDLFEGATVARMAACFLQLLRGIVADPDERLSHLPMLDEESRRRLLVGWNDAPAPHAQAPCVHETFARQAGLTPEAAAVVFGETRLSYRELDARANRLAHRLRKMGVRPETHVAVCLERSAEIVVALLATLKAGGAYVPLDPAYPRERLAYLLEDSGARVLLTQRSLDGVLPEHACPTLYLDRDWEAVARESAEPPAVELSPENVAYVIYTSGSTGQPKGVQVTHRALAAYTEAAAREYEIGAGDRVLQFASISFDTSVEEIYPCLTGGATLVVRDDSMLSTVGHFLDKCREQSLTVLSLPTAYWHEVASAVAAGGLGFPTSVRLLILGGEKVNAKHWDWWMRHVGQPPLLENTYGPTEATVVATAYKTPGDSPDASALREVPIGRPLPHTQVYVLDAHLQPMPVTVPGELYIGGAGLARGYLGRPGLTADRFVPHPFSRGGGERLYRTGDLARYRPDGDLEFLGRVDEQVKIRGFRVELGEVEKALCAHAEVEQAVVLLREDSGQKRLVAYVVPSGQKREVNAGPLRAFLRTKLPDYMVPAVFVALPALPLSRNGKVDRRALPAPPQSRPELEAGYVAPRTGVESELAEIWAKTLGVERVGVHDNFFELGGHSLLATQLNARIVKAFDVELPLRSLFEAPTVAGLAAIIEQQRRPEPLEDGSSDGAAGERLAGGGTRNIRAGRRDGAEELLKNVRQLSDEEVGALLDSLLAEGEAGKAE